MQGLMGGLFGNPEMQAYQQIRELGKQAAPMMQFGKGPAMPSMQGMPNVMNPAGPVASPYGGVPSQANPPPAFFPSMGGMPNPMTDKGRPMGGQMMANGNPMGGGMDPAAMAGLAGMMMGGDRQQQRMGMAPGGGTPRMSPMGMPQMMGVGQMLRRR